MSTLDFWLSTTPSHTRIAIAMLLLLFFLLNIRFTEKAALHGPTLLTTAGILATFVGIALGLAEFDVSNVQSSVPSLLAGLKTAFYASVAGVGGALFLKFRYYIFGASAVLVTDNPDDVTALHLYQTLGKIHSSLAGDDDSTLLSQLKLLRQESGDKLEALRRAQVEALEKLSQMGSQALIEALRSVIADFNTKITEQFGDNFKHLNQAVQRLNEWQQAYKEQVAATTERHSDMVAAIGQATADFSVVVNEASSFSKVANDLSLTLTSLEAQKTALAENLSNLARLVSSAGTNLPQIETKVLAIAEQLANSVKASQALVDNAIRENSTALKRSLELSAEQSAKVHQESLRQSTEIIAKTREQVELLERSLQQELNDSLEGLGRQLTALSQRFVADYGPLTDRLTALVTMVERVR